MNENMLIKREIDTLVVSTTEVENEERSDKWHATIHGFNGDVFVTVNSIANLFERHSSIQKNELTTEST